MHVSSAKSKRNRKLQILVKFDALDHGVLVYFFDWHTSPLLVVIGTSFPFMVPFVTALFIRYSHLFHKLMMDLGYV